MNYLSSRVAAGSILCAAVLTACDGGKATEPLPKPTQCIPQTLSILPRDTAVFVDGSYALNVQSVPTCQLTVALTYEAENGIVAIDSATRRVSGKAFGRGRLIVRAGQVADTVMVSVVPRGKFALTYSALLGGEGHAGVFSMNTDLSGRRRLHDVITDGFGGAAPVWLPAGDAILYGTYDAPDWVIDRVDTLGARTRITPAVTEVSQRWPRIAPDGNWVYYTFRTNFRSWHSLYRIPVSGGTPEEIRVTPSPANEGIGPSPSPDGRTLAFQSWASNGDPEIRFFDLQTRTDLPVRVRGLMPRYSPAGDRLAYWSDAAVWLAGADGAGPRRMTAEGRYYHEWVSWSPDGEWIAAYSSVPRRIEFIQVGTGLIVPLPATPGFGSPEWHPTARG